MAGILLTYSTHPFAHRLLVAALSLSLLGAAVSHASAVAMPLTLEDGAEVMAINCGGSSLRLDHDRLVNNLGPRLKEVAAKIRQELAPKYRASR